MTEASKRERVKTRVKLIKCQDPSIDGKVLDNVTGKKLVDTVKHVCLKP